MLAWIRACQPYRGVPLPPLYDFVTWIFQACGLSAEYVEGRAAAYGCMCRMMCRRHDQRLGNEYFAHFYRLVIKGLAGTDVNVIFAIINNSTRLFGLNLPGSTILIPAFLKCFRQLFFGVPKGSPFASFDGLQRSTDASQLVPESVRQNIAIMLSAIASTCNTVPDGTCIVLDFADGALAAAPHPSDPTAGESLVGLIEQVGRERRPPELSMVEAKTLAKSLLLALLRDDLDSQKLDERVASHRYLLNAICDMAYEELVLVSKLDRAVVDEGFSAILGHLLQRNLHAINAAVDCLNLFSQSFANLDRLDQNAAFGIIEKIVGAIQEHFAWVPAGRNQELVRACAIARLFYCLLDWLLCIPPEWFQNARFLHLVFDTIETGLNEGMPLVGPGSKRGRGPPESRPSRRPPARVNEESSTDISKSGSMASIEEGQEPGDQEPTLIRDAAENVLMHVLHHVNNFPPTNGPAMMNTSILDPELADDTDRSKTLYFSYNEKTLLTFVEMQGRTPLDSKVRVIVRDIAGKYCWDSWLFYDSLDKMREVLVGGDPALEGKLPPLLGVLDRMVFADDVTIESRTRKVTPDRSFDGELWSSENAARDPDRLKELLIAIGQRSPDCLRIPGHSLVEPEPVPEDQVAVVSEAAQRMKFQVEQERPILEKHAYPRKDDGGADSGDELSTAYFVPARPPEAEATIPPYHRTRLLLSHLGFVNFDSLRENNFYMLTKSPALFRDIKGLDKTVGRETIKVAVIYVGPGQEDEASILRNQRTSADYVEFVSSLGWEVDLASHAGYLGGLERNLTSGARATYFCNSTLEIIYHEVTKLPTDPNDPKQVKKKRHIGNDQVHVIWNEHPRDYRRNTISGDYANAQIVITPLANGFYAVDISRDPKVSPFGPLEPHSIVSKASLGALVRATCVAAHRYSLLSLTDKLDLYRHSYTQRVANLRMIKERHQTKTWTFEHFLRFLATGADS
ncbi:hypothetical protein DFJ74DRAFT_680173 [Hyaloraphidium curvatum]|nr:hypothetical protein DFJ74DRAFT_680173 [Hyaloraphidium curvatum]